MNILTIGGQSPRNKAWVDSVAENVKSEAATAQVLNYRHWSEGEPVINMEHELAAAKILADGMDEYIIIAKSIGSALACLAIKRGLLRPKACLFMGFPLKVIKESFTEVHDAIPSLPPTIFLQNENDPIGSYAEVREFMVESQPADYEVISYPDDTHDYNDFARIGELAKKVLSGL